MALVRFLLPANKSKIGIRSHDCSRGQGRDKLLDWMNDLHLVVLLAFSASCSSKIHKSNWTSRIDYVFVNYRLFRSTFQDILHDFRAKSGTALVYLFVWSQRALNLQDGPYGSAQYGYLNYRKLKNISQLRCTSLLNPFFRVSGNYNPGFLLDVHKRKDYFPT